MYLLCLLEKHGEEHAKTESVESGLNPDPSKSVPIYTPLYKTYCMHVEYMVSRVALQMHRVLITRIDTVCGSVCAQNLCLPGPVPCISQVINIVK